MSEIGRTTAAGRPRRADARRSVEAILDAAAVVLAEDPTASIEQVAIQARVTRQTVYAHFRSRDALLEALIDRASDEVERALDDADLDVLPAAEALMRLVQISWDYFDSAAFLLALPASADALRANGRHRPVQARLDRIVARGQRDGDLDPTLPPTWITAATIALGHTAGEQVRAGTLTATQAKAILMQALPRVFGC